MLLLYSYEYDIMNIVKEGKVLNEYKERNMEENMTDKQYDGILQMIGMILDGCKDLEEAKEKITELREGKKEKPTE